MACAGWMAWGRWTYWRMPIRPLPSAERSPQSRALEALTHGNSCLAAGQWADATAAFEQARAGSETALCGRAAGRRGPAATRRQRPAARRGRRVTARKSVCGRRCGSAGASRDSEAFAWGGWWVGGWGSDRQPPAPSRPEVPGIRTAGSPPPVRHIAGAIRPSHRAWDRVQGGVYGASSLYTSG